MRRESADREARGAGLTARPSRFVAFTVQAGTSRPRRHPGHRAVRDTKPTLRYVASKRYRGRDSAEPLIPTLGGTMPRRTRQRRSHLPAVAVAVVVLALLILAGGCGDDPGDEFVGDWTSAMMGEAVVTVTKDGDQFTIELPNKTYEGKMEDGAVFAPFDDPTIVLEMKGEDLIMRFYKEGNAILLSRKGTTPATAASSSPSPRSNSCDN